MSILTAIGGFLQLVLLIFSKWAEMDTDRKKKKAEIQKDLENALKNRDTSAINAIIDGMR